MPQSESFSPGSSGYRWEMLETAKTQAGSSGRAVFNLLLTVLSVTSNCDYSRPVKYHLSFNVAIESNTLNHFSKI